MPDHEVAAFEALLEARSMNAQRIAGSQEGRPN